MKLDINQMTYEAAQQISKWIYEGRYSIYSMDGSDGCIEELLDGSYFSASDEENNLLGYYCFGEAAQVPAGRKYGVYDDKSVKDIGLGIRPDLCGQGLGFDFFVSGIEFVRNRLSVKGFRLTVAAFNKRAINVYEKVGFKKVNSFKRLTENGETEFDIMVLQI